MFGESSDNKDNLQQFEFDFSNTQDYGQVSVVRSESVNHILHHTGVLQEDIYQQSVQSVCRKEGRSLGHGHRSGAEGGSHSRLIQTERVLPPCGPCPARCGEQTKERGSLPLCDRTTNGCSLISGETLLEVMSGRFQHLFDHYVVVDCRYDYEYAAGHIRGAISVQDKQLIERLYQANRSNQNVAWIFHCEFSKNRGPETCRFFRELDRKANAMNYPQISFSHTYVLDGGYKAFWESNGSNQSLFSTAGFTSMWDENFQLARRVHGEFRALSWGNKKKRSSRRKSRRQRRCSFGDDDDEKMSGPAF